MKEAVVQPMMTRMMMKENYLVLKRVHFVDLLVDQILVAAPC